MTIRRILLGILLTAVVSVTAGFGYQRFSESRDDREYPPPGELHPINERMAKITRVCAYDRAGMGYSEPAYEPTRAGDVVNNLHALLRSIHAPREGRARQVCG